MVNYIMNPRQLRRAWEICTNVWWKNNSSPKAGTWDRRPLGTLERNYIMVEYLKAEIDSLHELAVSNMYDVDYIRFRAVLLFLKMLLPLVAAWGKEIDYDNRQGS
jgi:hypothetical protein